MAECTWLLEWEGNLSDSSGVIATVELPPEEEDQEFGPTLFKAFDSVWEATTWIIKWAKDRNLVARSRPEDINAAEARENRGEKDNWLEINCRKD